MHIPHPLRVGRVRVPLFYIEIFFYLPPDSHDVIYRKFLYICSPKSYVKSKIGELAQLARALAWHARGRRFDSDILHSLLIRSQTIYGVGNRCFDRLDAHR